MRGGVDTIGKLMRANSEKILSIRNLGKKSFQEALYLKKQIPKLLIQSICTESDLSDDVKNTFETMVTAFALTDKEEIEDLRLYCYHFNDPEDTEQERLEMVLSSMCEIGCYKKNCECFKRTFCFWTAVV